METKAILSANLLDILFDGRNKEYGAYELRKSYEKRIGTALGSTAVFILLFAVAMFWKSSSHTTVLKPFEVPGVIIDVPPAIPLPPKPMLPSNVHVRTIVSVPPLIVPDNQVTKPPVENNASNDAKIDTKESDGNDDKGLSAPVEIKSLPSEEPAKKEDSMEIQFNPKEIEAEFKGNWGAYVKKEIEKNIDELTDAGESGTCIVKFVVSKVGAVSEVEAITMKGTKLAEVAVNAIRKGPRWIPARQNGKDVNTYHQQPVSFQINE